MTRPSYGRKTKAVKKGKLPKSKLKGASKQMHRGMTMDELESHSKEAKGKKLPKRKQPKKVDRFDRADLKARKKQRNWRAG